MHGRVFASGGEAYFALATERRLWRGAPVLPEAAPVGALSAQSDRLAESR